MNISQKEESFWLFITDLSILQPRSVVSSARGNYHLLIWVTREKSAVSAGLSASGAYCFISIFHFHSGESVQYLPVLLSQWIRGSIHSTLLGLEHLVTFINILCVWGFFLHVCLCSVCIEFLCRSEGGTDSLKLGLQMVLR